MYLKTKAAGCLHLVSFFSAFWFFFLILCPGCTSVRAESLVPLHVEKGTNLIHIARRYCINESDWKTIAKMNNLKSPYIIYADSTLRIPLSLLVTKNISARVASVTGSPRLVTGDQTTILHKGDLVLPGQTVITGSNDYVHLMYPNHKHTRIGPESEMTLVYLIRLTDDNLQAEFSLKKGKITHDIRRKLKVNEHFETRTPVSITGIRGTEFRLKMIGSKINIVETLKGRVTVSAAGKQLILNKDKGAIVNKGRPPSPPRNLPASPDFPQIEEVYRTLPVVILAPGHPKNTTSMQLRVTTDEPGLNTVTELISQPGQDFTLTSLADGQYYLFLTALDRGGFESLPAGPVSLFIRTMPAAPIISKPNNGLKTFASSIKIRWLKSEQAKDYKIQLATDSDFSTPIEEQQTKEAFYTTGELTPGTYFFRVQLIAEDGFSTLFSEPLSWTVVEQPKLESMDSTIQGENGITLQWAAMAGMSGYMLQVATDRKFTHPIVSEENLTEPSYTITNHLDAGKYFVRICAIMKEGPKSPWTPAMIMTIDPEPFGIEHVFISLAFIAMILL